MLRIEDMRARVRDADAMEGNTNPMDKVLVTGATGHLGLAVVRCLLEEGYATYAAARTNSVHRLAPLRSTDAEVVPLDVTDPRQVDRAIAGMDGVIHVAAAHTVVTSSDAAPVRAAIESGTKNILHACKRHDVRKLVLTSSAAATGTALPHEPARDERDWNGTTTDPYLRAKTNAEANAWAFAQTHGLQLAAVLPSAVIGPGFYRHTPTTRFFAEIVHNKIPFVAPLMLNLVDVRDVARAHVLAYANEGAQGRYIVAGDCRTLADLFVTLHTLSSDIRVPSFRLPPALLGLIPASDWLSSRLSRRPRGVTRALLADYGLRQPRFSTAKAAKELGWRPRELTETLADTLVWLRTHSWLSSSNPSTPKSAYANPRSDS